MRINLKHFDTCTKCNTNILPLPQSNGARNALKVHCPVCEPEQFKVLMIQFNEKDRFVCKLCQKDKRMHALKKDANFMDVVDDFCPHCQEKKFKTALKWLQVGSEVDMIEANEEYGYITFLDNEFDYDMDLKHYKGV